MENTLTKLKNIKQEKEKLIEIENQLLEELTKANVNMIHSYIEMPEINSNLNISSEDGIEETDALGALNKAFSLHIALPNVHLILVSSFWIHDNYENSFYITAENIDDCWFGLWHEKTKHEHIVELNTSKLGDILSENWCAKEHKQVKLDSGSNSNISIFDFITQSKELALVQIDEFFKELTNSKKLVLNGKPFHIHPDEAKTIKDNLNNIVDNLVSNIKMNIYSPLLEYAEEDEVKELQLLINKYETTFKMIQLEKELPINNLKPNRRKI